MAERLLCEREVLVKLDWPSRHFLERRIKGDGFPGPARRFPGLGDQWRESDVESWLGTPGAAQAADAGRKFDEMFGAS